MKKIMLIAAALAAVNAFAITATKEYVDNATNATLAAAKEYTNERKIALSSVTNSSGGAVYAPDVGALDDWEADANAEADSWTLRFPYYGNAGQHRIDISPSSGIYLKNNTSGKQLTLDYSKFKVVSGDSTYQKNWADILSLTDVQQSFDAGEAYQSYPTSISAVKNYLTAYYLTAQTIGSTYLTQQAASSTYETKAHASDTYATKQSVTDAVSYTTAVSNRMENVKNEITVVHAADDSQYFNGKGEVYRRGGVQPAKLVSPNAAFSAYADFEMSYDTEMERYYTSNTGFIGCYGPRSGGATMAFIKYRNGQWELFGDNSFVMDTASDSSSSEWIHFTWSGMWSRPTQGGMSHVDDIAYTSNLSGYVPTSRTVNGKALSSNVSLSASDVGAATTGYVDQQNAATRAIVATWENFLDGSNVVFSITNYISGTYNLDAAKLRIMEMTNGVYREVYNSREEILLHINDFKNTDFAAATNQVIQGVSAAIADKADKAWGKYTSAGGDAPSNTVYMTAPQTVFAGGMEYERVAVGEGSVCILTTKGAPTYTQGDEGTFKFQDDGGTNYFGFAKTDSYVIGADASGISVQNHIVTINYDVTMSGVPCIWYKADLTSNVAWEQLNLPDGTPVAGASHVVSWEATPPAGKEICYINCPEAKGFFKATIEVAGSAKFMTNMPADLSGGIFCTDGQHKVKINWNNGAPTIVPAN